MRARRWSAWWVCAVAAGLASCELRPVCPPDLGPRCLADVGYSHDEANYKVDGEDVRIKFKDGNYVHIMCPKNLSLDNPALPRFQNEIRVRDVTFDDCLLRKHSYEHALRVLNVVALDTITIVKARQEITSAHLIGLKVSSLDLEQLNIAPDAFDAFNDTTYLSILRLTRVSPVQVGRLPNSLQDLKLEFTNIKAISRADLESLSALTKLTIRDNGNVSVEVNEEGSLQELTLEADSVLLLGQTLPNTLIDLTLKGWAEAAPKRWDSCKSLQKLYMRNSKISALPSDWLVNCKELLELTLKEFGLKELPKGLLDNAKKLSYLDLNGNQLQELPSGLFTNTRQIKEVDISDNELTKGAFNVVASPSLKRLELSGNARLGDACSDVHVSPRDLSRLRDLVRLRHLGLARTGATVLCRDFRENMLQLNTLDLSDNLITELRLTDLVFRANVNVNLEGNNVTKLLYEWNEYVWLTTNRCDASHSSSASFRFSIAVKLECDCRLAAAARVLHECDSYVPRLPLQCADGHALAAVPWEELMCAAPARHCGVAAPCRCHWRAAPDAHWRARPVPRFVLWQVQRVTCSSAGLTRAPRADATELLLPNNSISLLTRDDLPPRLTMLDVRNNTLRRLEPSIVESLGAEGRLWLSGNPLSCDCDDAPAIAALLARSDRVLDFKELRCPDGGPLRAPDCSARAAPLAAVLAPLPLVALAALLAGCLARREARGRLKALLRVLGWLPPRAEPDDDERPYDAFVSFSHLDSAVVRELLEGLEGGARPYRVCVHYRDWAPGGWIPAQIAASVRRSRRTLAVVSEHFLGSAWARAEFREAHAAALRDPEQRLVVVLLDEPARLPLDDELRRYLAANTYVRWRDPWFWHKLRAALPPPRGPYAPPAPPSTEVAVDAGPAEPARRDPADLAAADAERQPLVLPAAVATVR